MSFIISIDQGTTSSRAILFDDRFDKVASHQVEFTQHFPNNGWVEHDATEIWQTVYQSIQQILATAQISTDRVAAIGITNQRETVVAWQPSNGEPIAPAIVWQDRRTEGACQQLKRAGYESMVVEKTGLLLDPYFSASKIQWLLDNTPNARELAAANDLLVGTIDSWLIWKLTGGMQHLTDATNASRTQLFNIHTQQWDDELLTLFNVPRQILPAVKDCAANFGECDQQLFGSAVPIRGVAGDQQAALVGQRCFKAGDVKSTYGTGCFVMVNTGTKPVLSQHRLLTTIAYRVGGEPCYALEGSIFMAGATIQWLRDALGIISSAGETDVLASEVPIDHGVVLVPAFTGLGAPHWNANARACLSGMTRATTRQHIASAALQSVVFQSVDLFNAIVSDGVELTRIKVDGGMVKSELFCQWLADFSSLQIQRSAFHESTALGAAYFAALGAGLITNLDELKSQHESATNFTPALEGAMREKLLNLWHQALAVELRRNPCE